VVELQVLILGAQEQQIKAMRVVMVLKQFLITEAEAVAVLVQ
jgi:hypothetical protein